MAVTATTYAVADISALKALTGLPSSGSGLYYARYVEKIGWHGFDPDASTGGIAPNTGTGRWFPLERETLRADRTYFVRTDGNDSNAGLANTSGGAFLTIQKAIDVAASLDMGIFNVTIQVADGTYSQQIKLKTIVGSGTVTLQGNTTTPANVTITSASFPTITNDTSTLWNLRGFTIACTDPSFKIGILVTNNGQISFNNLVFPTTSGGYHILATGSSKASCIGGSYQITGGSLYHLIAELGGQIDIRNTTVTLTGTPAFTAYAFAQGCSPITLLSNTYSGSATGSQYTIRGNAALYNAGATLPGNSGGTTATGGQVF